MKPRDTGKIHTYSEMEERLNVWTHLAGLLLSVAGLILLIIRAFSLNSLWAVISFSVFGLSMVTLYLASTLYHNAEDPRLRYRLNIFDHAAIYVLIAGSYTPFTLVTLHGPLGFTIFGLVWGLAVAGIIFKIFFTGRFGVLSTVLYVAMGWIIVFSFRTLKQNLGADGIFWLIVGGVAYTVGALLYSLDRIKFNHAVIHIFVLAGTLCHFISVYFYVVPVAVK